MSRTLSFYASLILLIALLMVLTLLNNTFLKSYQVDLTENQVYSLSDGSISIITGLDEPVDLYYFFSDKATKGMTSLRTYAERVERLLRTYAAKSNGNVRLHVIDPEPFSEAEDQAAEFGLTGAQLTTVGDAIYFGLAGTNLLDDQSIIGFFDPQQEQFLEYEISKLIYQLSNPSQPKVALVTDLPVAELPNPMTGRIEPAMVFYTQLQQFYEVTVVSASEQALPDNTDLVVMAHATELTESLKQSIDAHLMQSGKLVVFADPLFESSRQGLPGQASDTSLLQAWGISITPQVLLDPGLALDIRGAQGQVVSHPGIIGITAQSLNSTDIVTTNFDSLNLSSAGVVGLTDGTRLSLTPVMQSSQRAELIDASTYRETMQPEQLNRLLTGQGTRHIVGARINGRISSAYENGKGVDANMLVVADADLLTDRFWVQQSNFFGQTIVTPFANNGDLVINSVDNLSGSAALISVRSRGTYSRPFARVAELEADAESMFREQEKRLQFELDDIEAQLAQLQSTDGASALTVNDEQEAAIEAFMAKRMDIRRELREVRLQLERDIALLGNQLKLLNILAAPVVLTLFVWGLARLLRARAPKLEQGN